MQSHIFAPRCGTAGCHEGQRASVGLDLVAPDVVARLLRATSDDCNGRRLLVPGDPDVSYLFQKLTGASPVCGSRMPLGGDPLSSMEVACVRAWITSLAGADAGAIDAGVRPTSDASMDAAAPDASADAGPGCPAGQLACGAACVNPMTDGANCGGCGRACPAGLSCSAGACACPTGQTACGSRCVNTATDGMNCGMCGRACPAGQSCAAGACVCPVGATLCSGACVDTQSSATNCGACGRACASGQSCSGGACVCPSGQTLCGGRCVDTATDTADCGACGRACPAGQTCAGGSCTSTCPAGQVLCGGQCVTTATDPSNCGACGRACASGQTCSGGACASCSATPVSYGSQVQPIFNATCVTGCHGGVRPSGDMTLVSGSSYRALVNAASGCGTRLRVAPGLPGSSYLVDKLTGSNLCSGGQMPLRGAALPGSQIDLIRTWICQGAPNN